MFKPKAQTPVAPAVPHRRLSYLVVVVLLFLIYHFLPVSRHDRIVNGKWLPDYNVGERPHYLHRSPYEHDYDNGLFELRVSEALQEIEEYALESADGDRAAEDRIWQIRLGSQGDAERSPDSVKFSERNNEWQYTLVTDEKANHFINNVFSTVPELKQLYDSYPYDVIRSDLLRYLLLWYFGGYYADMDVYPAKPIKRCPSLQPVFTDLKSGTGNISLAVGIEIDEPHASAQLMRDWHWIRTYGFIQYTFYAPQRFSPLLREVIVKVLSHTREHNKHSWPIIGPRYNEKTILEVTGPGVFTDAILVALSRTLPTTHPLITTSIQADEGIGDLLTPSGSLSRKVTWAPFHKIHEPVCVDAREAKQGESMGGLCVLPVNAWGNGQRHSGAESFRSEHACVNHRFGGTWKKDWWHRTFG